MIQKCNGLAEVPEQDDSLEQELQAIQSKKQRKIVTGQNYNTAVKDFYGQWKFK